MTDLQEKERPRDLQDAVERHVWGEIEYVPGAGAVLRARGTGTVDEDMPVIVAGYSMHLPKDTNAEVLAFSMGSDTNLKFALPTIPHDKQRQWPVNTGGIQAPMDPNRYLEFNEKRTHLKDGAYAFGAGGELEISGNKVIIRGDATITGNLNVNGELNVGSNVIKGVIVAPGTPTSVAGFDA